MSLEVAVAQIKPRKADYASNLARIGDILEQVDAMSPRPDVLVLPETVLSGYFLEGGVRDVAISRDQLHRDLQRVYAERTKPGAPALDVVLGFYELADGKYYNAGLYATLASGARDDLAGIGHVHHKFFLPTYGVFDEQRFVARGRTIDAFDTRFGRAAILICEDVWHSISGCVVALKGAQIVFVLSASPGRGFSGEEIGNLARWQFLLPGLAAEHSVFVVYAGLVGFEGGKGFTGSSCVVDPSGRMLVQGPVTEECLLRASIDPDDVAIARASSPLLSDLEASLSDLVHQLDAVARRPHA